MLLKGVSTKRQELGKVIDQAVDKEYKLSIRKFNDPTNHTYKIYMNQEDSKVGSVMFIDALSPSPGFVFHGMHVNGEYSGNGFSDVLFEVLYKYAKSNENSVLSTTKQKKPIIGYILRKHGFIPKEIVQRNIVYILESDNGIMSIAFEDESKEKEFRHSRVMKFSGQYFIIEEFDEDRVLDRIVLSSTYELAELEKNKERRKKVRERFKVELS